MSDEPEPLELVEGAVFGLDVLSLPEGWIPLEAVIVVKALDEDGDPVICQRFTQGVSTWESIGLLTVAADTLRRNMTDHFVREVPDDDGQEDEDDGEPD